MGLIIAIIVLVVLVAALLAMLTGMMSWPRRLRPHRPGGGQPAARMRRFRPPRRRA
jgi:uncharacterized iron-regulated membrane protein